MAKVSQEITPVIEDLRSKVMLIEADGDTSIWDALILAETRLTKYAETYPRAKKRILALSDGEDNRSNHAAHEACLRLQVALTWNTYTYIQRANIVVDSFEIGDLGDAEFRAISYA
jgi:Mg-chelatase subunit ChlD